jgi:hypothetical protein
MLGSQLANGQQYVTITTSLTSVQTSTVAIGTQTVTTTTAQPRPIFSAPITIPPTHGVCGVYFIQAFNATSGDILSGTLTMDNKGDLYVMAYKSFQAWSHQLVAGGKCTPPNPLILQQNETSYNFSATIPSNGVYELVVNNLSHSTVSAQLNAVLTTPTAATAAITAYSTMTQQVIQTLMQTSTQTVGGGPDLTTLAVGIIAVIVIVAVGYMALTKRRRTGKK